MAQRCQTITGFCIILSMLAATPLVVEADKSVPGLSREELHIKHTINRIVQRVQESHQLSIEYEGLQSADFHQTALIFQEAAPQDYRRMYSFLRLLQEELERYPSGFFRPGNIQKIYLVKGLFNEEKNAQGIYDYRRKILMFDFARQFGGDLIQRHNIHHEFFHVIDTNSFYWQGKVDWEDLNAPDFEYIKKGKVHIDPEPNEANYFAPTRKGFVTYYAMMTPHEDKAEVFACLFVRSQNRLIHRWAEKDSILRKKIQYIKDFLNTYSDGAIDDQYLSDLWGAPSAR